MRTTYVWIGAAVLICGATVACGGDGKSNVIGTGGSGSGGNTSSGGTGQGGFGGDIADPVFGPATFENGLGKAGDWEGYLWTAAETGSTISPENFDDAGAEICVSGATGPSYEEWGMVGWNIAQDIDPITLEGKALHAIAPGGVGVRVEVNNIAGSKLRIQLNADDEGGESWCAPAPESGKGVIPWESFHKECWMTGGEAYDPRTPIMQVAVQAFAMTETAPTEFEYCVIDLGATD